MSCFLFLNLFKKFTKYRKNKYIHRPSITLYDSSIHNTIPYEDLWYSAIRCKLIHKNHNAIHKLWTFCNRERISYFIDSVFTSELRSVSEPVHYNTKNDNTHNHNNSITTVYLWTRVTETTPTVYITFHVEKEKDLMKHDMELCSIIGSKNIEVNRHFYKQFLVLSKSIINHLKPLSDTSCKLVISGYSLGGIITQIASAVFAEMFPNFQVHCHTFGSPRAGNSAFVEWFTKWVKENYRIVNGNDPMTLIPVQYHWEHVCKTTLQLDTQLHFQIITEDIPWYERLCVNKKIMKHIRSEYKYDHDFDVYIHRLWNYTRITNYANSSKQLGDLVQSSEFI